jgi:hypothetical protein
MRETMQAVGVKSESRTKGAVGGEPQICTVGIDLWYVPYRTNFVGSNLAATLFLKLCVLYGMYDTITFCSHVVRVVVENDVETCTVLIMFPDLKKIDNDNKTIQNNNRPFDYHHAPPDPRREQHALQSPRPH